MQAAGGTLGTWAPLPGSRGWIIQIWNTFQSRGVIRSAKALFAPLPYANTRRLCAQVIFSIKYKPICNSMALARRLWEGQVAGASCSLTLQSRGLQIWVRSLALRSFSCPPPPLPAATARKICKEKEICTSNEGKKEEELILFWWEV